MYIAIFIFNGSEFSAQIVNDSKSIGFDYFFMLAGCIDFRNHPKMFV